MWLAPCDVDSGPEWEIRQLGLLHESERQRYHRFVRPHRRRQFLVGRVLLRHALSTLFNRSFASWHITECPGKAPSLESDTPWPLTFSIAHSLNQVVCVLACHAAVGVDIEHAGRHRDFLSLASHTFPAESVRQLQAMGVQERAAGFYRLWTLHEAVLKACSRCEDVRRSNLGSCGWSQSPVLATTTLGEYSLALAMCGDVLPPRSIRLLSPGATVEMSENVSWDHHAGEQFISERSFTGCTHWRQP
jgi:4'-phosphopantetheinyl transferase